MVEILVVLAVIFALVALLLPAVTAARQKATAAVCASNMRQVYQASIAFAQDNEGRLPVPTWVQETAQTTGQAFQRRACWVNVENGPGGGLISFEVGGLWRYLGTGGAVNARQGVLTCPGDRDERSLRGGQRSYRNFSYSYNEWIRKPGGDVGNATAIRFAQVLHPSEKIMVYEELGPNDAWCTIPFAGVDDVPAGRHGNLRASNKGRLTGEGAINQLPAFFNNGLGNQCFFDGHVELISPRWIVEERGANKDHRSHGPLTMEAWPPSGPPDP